MGQETQFTRIGDCKIKGENMINETENNITDINRVKNFYEKLFDKVSGTLRRSGNKLYYSELLRRCKVDQEHLKSILKTMEEVGMIKWDEKRNIIELIKDEEMQIEKRNENEL